MERDGLVERITSTVDLRVRQLQLTSAGRALVARILSRHDEQLNKILGGLDPSDQIELSRLLSIWGRHLQELTGTNGTVAHANGRHQRKPAAGARAGKPSE